MLNILVAMAEYGCSRHNSLQRKYHEISVFDKRKNQKLKEPGPKKIQQVSLVEDRFDKGRYRDKGPPR